MNSSIRAILQDILILLFYKYSVFSWYIYKNIEIYIHNSFKLNYTKLTNLTKLTKLQLNYFTQIHSKLCSLVSFTLIRHIYYR